MRANSLYINEKNYNFIFTIRVYKKGATTTSTLNVKAKRERENGQIRICDGRAFIEKNENDI